MASKYLGLYNAYRKASFFSEFKPYVENVLRPRIGLRGYHDAQDSEKRSRQRQMKHIRVRVGKSFIEKCKRTPITAPRKEEPTSLATASAAEAIETVPDLKPIAAPKLAATLCEDPIQLPVPSSPAAEIFTPKSNNQTSEAKSLKDDKESAAAAESVKTVANSQILQPAIAVTKAADVKRTEEVKSAHRIEKAIQNKPKTVAPAKQKKSQNPFAAMLKKYREQKTVDVQKIIEQKETSQKTAEMQTKQQPETDSTGKAAAVKASSKQVPEITPKGNEAAAEKTTVNEINSNQVAAVEEAMEKQAQEVTTKEVEATSQKIFVNEVKSNQEAAVEFTPKEVQEVTPKETEATSQEMTAGEVKSNQEAAVESTPNQVQEVMPKETEAAQTTTDNEVKSNHVLQGKLLDKSKVVVDKEKKTKRQRKKKSLQKKEKATKMAELKSPNQDSNTVAASCNATTVMGVSKNIEWKVDESAEFEESFVKIKPIDKFEDSYVTTKSIDKSEIASSLDSAKPKVHEELADVKRKVVIEVKGEVYDSLKTTDCVNKLFDNVENCEYEIYQDKNEPIQNIVEGQPKEPHESEDKKDLVIKINDNDTTPMSTETITTGKQIDAIGTVQKPAFSDAYTANSLATTSRKPEKIKDAVEQPKYTGKHPIYEADNSAKPNTPNALSLNDDDNHLYSTKHETHFNKEPEHRGYELSETNEKDVNAVNIDELKKATFKKNKLSATNISHTSADVNATTDANQNASQMQDINTDQNLNVPDVADNQSLAQYLYEKIMGVGSKHKEKHQNAASNEGTKREYATLSLAVQKTTPALNYNQNRKVTTRYSDVFISPDVIRQGLGAKAILNERSAEAQDFSTLTARSTTMSDTKSFLTVKSSSSTGKRESQKSFSMLSIELLPQSLTDVETATDRTEERCVLLLPSTLDEPEDVTPAVPETPKAKPPPDVVSEIKILGGTKATPRYENPRLVNFSCEKSCESNKNITIKGGSKKCKAKNKSTRKSSTEKESAIEILGGTACKGASQQNDCEGKQNFGTLMPSFIRTLWMSKQMLPSLPSNHVPISKSTHTDGDNK